MNVSQQISQYLSACRKWAITSHLFHHCRHYISGGHGESHRYNHPNITAKQFLIEVMRDASVSIEDRVRAASALMGIEPDGPNHNHPDASMNQSAAVH